METGIEGRTDLVLLGAAAFAAALTYQHWGLTAAVAASAVAGVVGLRRALPLPLALAAAAAAGSGLIHFAVAPEHFGEWWGFGTFFVLCGEAQFGWALLVRRRPSGRLVAFGAWASVALVLLWALSRTSGLPFGPDPGVAERVGTPDLVAVFLELISAAGCVFALATMDRTRTVLLPVRVACLAGLAGVTALAILAI